MQWLLMYSYCAAVWCPRPHRNTYIYVFILILHTFWRCLHAARSMCACVCARHVQCTVYPFWQASLPLWPKRVDRLRPSDIQTFGRPLPAAHTNKAKWQWQTQMQGLTHTRREKWREKVCDREGDTGRQMYVWDSAEPQSEHFMTVEWPHKHACLFPRPRPHLIPRFELALKDDKFNHQYRVVELQNYR